MIEIANTFRTHSFQKFATNKRKNDPAAKMPWFLTNLEARYRKSVLTHRDLDVQVSDFDVQVFDFDVQVRQRDGGMGAGEAAERRQVIVTLNKIRGFSITAPSKIWESMAFWLARLAWKLSHQIQHCPSPCLQPDISQGLVGVQRSPKL